MLLPSVIKEQTEVIVVEKLNGKQFVLNANLIETVEATPDTVVKLTSGKSLMIKTSVDEIVKRTIQYNQLCNQTIQVIDKIDYQRSKDDIVS